MALNFVVPPRPLRPRFRDVAIGIWLYFQIGSLAVLVFGWSTIWAGVRGELRGTQLQLALQEPRAWAIFASVLFELYWVSRLVMVRGSGSFAIDLGLKFKVVDLGFGFAAWVLIYLGSLVLDHFVFPYILPTADDAGPFSRVGEYSGMSPLAKAVVLMTIGLLVPFAEEMMFRGVLLKACSRWMGPIVGILVSSAFFGYLHAEVWVAPQIAHAIWAAWAGVVFATLRVGTDRLGPGIVAHAIQNSIVVGLALAAHG